MRIQNLVKTFQIFACIWKYYVVQKTCFRKILLKIMYFNLRATVQSCQYSLSVLQTSTYGHTGQLRFNTEPGMRHVSIEKPWRLINKLVITITWIIPLEFPCTCGMVGNTLREATHTLNLSPLATPKCSYSINEKPEVLNNVPPSSPIFNFILIVTTYFLVDIDNDQRAIQ